MLRPAAPCPRGPGSSRHGGVGRELEADRPRFPHHPRQSPRLQSANLGPGPLRQRRRRCVRPQGAASFEDRSFDASISNSVIEHGPMGDEGRQAPVLRRRPVAWPRLHTGSGQPSRISPIEPHTGIPLYWDLPHTVRESILSSWNRRYPGWVDMLRETRVLSRRRMKELFPEFHSSTWSWSVGWRNPIPTIALSSRPPLLRA